MHVFPPTGYSRCHTRFLWVMSESQTWRHPLWKTMCHYFSLFMFGPPLVTRLIGKLKERNKLYDRNVLPKCFACSAGFKYMFVSSCVQATGSISTFLTHCFRNFLKELVNFSTNIYYLLTGCKGRTRKYRPKVFHRARACEGCLENQGLVFPGTARAPS